MSKKRGKRSAEGAMRHRMRGIENQLAIEARRQRRDPRNTGLDPMQLSRMAAGITAAAAYTADSRLKDTRDGVMVKGRQPKRASDRELLGSTVLPDDLTVSARVWNAETDERETIMVPAVLKDIAEPPSKQTRPLTAAEAYKRRAW
jgi:hypothetical protein